MQREKNDENRSMGAGRHQTGEGVVGTCQAKPKLSLEGWARVSSDGMSKWIEQRKGAPSRENSIRKSPEIGESIQGAASSSMQLQRGE